MPKVTMALTDRDAENASEIQTTTDARSKAHALSIALSLTRFLIDRLLMGSELMIRDQDGNLERVVFSELAHLRKREIQRMG